MHRLEALLASVELPWHQGDVHDIEDRIEHVRGISEVSINPVSGNALIVFDKSKTNLTRLRHDVEGQGIHISKVLMKKTLTGF